jgi:hypothetical protein
MKRIILALLSGLALTLSTCLAQEIKEYGKPEELKGVTKIYVSLVFAGSVELKDRDRIIKEIEKAKKKHKFSNLQVVDRQDDAEVLVIYSEVVDEGERKWKGRGLVVKPLSDGKYRLLMASNSSQVSWLQNAPATSFGREFMKAYVRANIDTARKQN